LSLFGFQADGLTQVLQHEYATGDRSTMIGDDMGLGKTVEAIVLDIERRKRNNCAYTAQTLVVTQTSVMGAWEKHYKEWAPWLKVIVVDRKNRHKFVQAMTAKDAKGFPTHHIFICHWQGLRFMREELSKVKWFNVIGDEIQNIKNRKAQQSQVFKKLQTHYKCGLSGTWADNKPEDAWSVLNWLWPKTWSTYWGFFNYHVISKKHEEGFCPDCAKQHKRAFTTTEGVHDVELIHKTMGNAYLRRTKFEVWKDLPEKIYEDRPVELDPKQRTAYDAMAKDMLAWIGKNEDQPLTAPAAISQLVRLQQFAVAYGHMEEKTWLKKYTPDQLAYRAMKGLGDEKTYEHHTVQLVLTEPSSKLDAAMDIIEATNGQVVVFGQSKQAINLLALRLQRAGISTFALTGDAPQKDRDVAIQEFQDGKIRVFCSTIKAGGVGITLTAASLAVFLDWAWSPSANKQAEDRLHRLGQKNACTYIRLVARDTIDLERNAKIELKWEWLKQLLNPKKG
jgi:SNF2 family DNA or RNA helicase